ncbi:hypothetical protein RFI_01171 [Reticulomyxa filosa]|uniref:U-box domain-containing protein n=1 Tax=Reticulomyxa filosa TaxID=46433 RepID=X6PBM2_RETFI|nr:hypothetical protein RFI_01171 [Reticulomyxa filosa]|eukprot:ETO35890.1 hypothetical protein RFI_01171 [Reticulomyxa filosa]
MSTQLPELPKSFTATQCILFKEELLICGGKQTNDCYSYHTLKKQYKYICSYPNDVKLSGHCVVQLIHSQTNPNEIDLLSFGGQGKDTMKQTFSMKYKSVWEISDHNHHSNLKSENQSFNTWIRHNEDTNIGKFEDNLIGVRGLIGGKIMIYYNETIEKWHNTKRENKFGIQYHCFVPLTMNNEKVINHFILFCRNTGLLIKYDEQNQTFHYEKLPISTHTQEKINSVYKYSMKDKTWNECKITLPMKISLSFAILNDDTNVHVIGGLNGNNELKMHVSMNIEQLFEKAELLELPKAYELKKEIARLKEITIRAKRKTELLKKVTSRIKIKKDFKISQEWESRKIGMEALDKQLKEWDEEKRTELNEMNWDDIWSFDGAFEQARNNDFTRANSIPSIIKTLLGHRTSIKIDVNTTTKEFDEIIEKQNLIKQKIDEKYLQKIQLKKGADEAVMRYTECAKQYNDLCWMESDLEFQKQQKKQEIGYIDELLAFNDTFIKGFGRFTEDLQKLTQDNQKWIDEHWKELQQKWHKWNSQEIAIFIGHTLKCKKSKINLFHQTIQKNTIDSMALLKMSKKDWMDIFELKMFSQACIIHDSFAQTCHTYPIDAMSRGQEDIPKEYLCPLSKRIMADPVIALDGVTYDRSSIINHYHNLSYSSLTLDGELKLFPDSLLQQKIQNFLKSSK